MTDIFNDLVELKTFDVDTICKILQQRYEQQNIYTYIGDILISINPYKDLEIFSNEASQKYCNYSAKYNLPAHVYATSYEIFRTLVKNGMGQTVIPCGVSGSGKSVCCKLLTYNLAELTCRNNTTLLNKLSVLGPFMEMFLNAQTNQNLNSTRCAKLIQMFVNGAGNCEGVFFSYYLLDKNHLIQLRTNERTFHIFYYMLAGLEEKKLKVNLLENPDKHKLVQLSDGAEIFKDKLYVGACKKRWQDFNNYLNQLGFIPDEQESILAVLTSVVHLKDLHFIHDHDTDGVYVSNEEVLDIVSSLLGFNGDVLAGYLITSEVIIKGEKICMLRNLEDVTQCRDVLVADLYERLVNWVTFRVNRNLFPKIMRTSKLNRITILDAFGFEDNSKIGNHYQQLQINLFNEQMTYHYNKLIFRFQWEEYQLQTGVTTYQMAQYKDNLRIMELLVNPGFLTNILNEESLNMTSSDLQLIQKFSQQLANRTEFDVVKEHSLLFTINHTISTITYSVHDFISENRNKFENKFLNCFRKSESQFVVDMIQCRQLDDEISCLTDSMKRNRKSRLLTEPINKREPDKKKLKSRMLLLSQKFKKPSSDYTHNNIQDIMVDKHSFKSVLAKECMFDLLHNKLNTDTFFIRCLCPNKTKSSDLFDREYVMRQLSCFNVAETVQLYNERHVYFVPFMLFIQKYKVLHYPLHSHVEPTSINCLNILADADISGYIIGKDKILLKCEHQKELDIQLKRYLSRVRTCQSSIRGYLVRKQFKLQLRPLNNKPTNQREESNNPIYVNHHYVMDNLVASAGGGNNEIYMNINNKNNNKINNNNNNNNNNTNNVGSNKLKQSSDKPAQNSTFWKELLNDSLLSFPHLSKQIWLKIFFIEDLDNLVSKFYSLDREVIINNSSEAYKGRVIGLRMSDFTWSSPHTNNVLDALGEGFKITRNDVGDVFLEFIDSNAIISICHPFYSLPCSETVAHHNKISNRPFRIFNMSRFKETIKHEMYKGAMFNLKNIELASMATLNLHSNLDGCNADERVTLLLINFSALDIIGDYDVYKELTVSDKAKHIALETWLKLKRTRT